VIVETKEGGEGRMRERGKENEKMSQSLSRY